MTQRKKILRALLGGTAIALTLFARGDLTPDALLGIVADQAAQFSSSAPSPSRGSSPGARRSDPSGGETNAVQRAFENRQSGVMVQATGRVHKTLSDDNEGSRHQRFIVAVDGGPTVLVAHNIDLASRVPLRTEDRVEIYGQYEFNDRGGVLHWTHHDPKGRHPGGWIRHAGKVYE